MGMKKFLSIAMIALSLTACNTVDPAEVKQKEIEEMPVETLYNRAAAALDGGNYFEARDLFEEVERLHPYSKWASNAQLMAAYASYSAQQYEDAYIALDRFIELHPGHKDVDYAYYLKAISFYEQISDVRRDQAMTKDALNAFDTLINRFPDSKYVRDAALKKDLTLDHLAGKEMEIGRYYIRRGEINAAINRFLIVVREFQTTTHVPEALHRLVESYLTLGLKDQAVRIAAVLGHNYPGNKWYAKTYALLDDSQRSKVIANRGLVDRTIDSLFRPE